MKRKADSCPICAAPTVRMYLPFCSKRCADVDLGRWLGERYAIAGEPWNGKSEAHQDNDIDDRDNDEEPGCGLD